MRYPDIKFSCRQDELSASYIVRADTMAPDGTPIGSMQYISRQELLNSPNIDLQAIVRENLTRRIESEMVNYYSTSNATYNVVTNSTMLAANTYTTPTWVSATTPPTSSTWGESTITTTHILQQEAYNNLARQRLENLYRFPHQQIVVDDLGYHVECVNPYIEPVETEEERFEREWNDIIQGKKKKAADDRALGLLLRNLSKEQLKRFEEDKCIPIDGESGTKYLITPARSINIKVVGKHHKLCAGIERGQNVPLFDAMLAQKLLLEADEKRFLEVANVWRD